MDQVDAILAQWNRERPDLNVVPMGVIGRLHRISRHLQRETEATQAQHGLNASSFDVLATLRRSGPPYVLSPGALSGAMMITSGTMTNRIDQLEKAGLVTRTPNPEDARGVLIGLTAEGFVRVDAAVTDHVATQCRVVAGLPPDALAGLDALLSRFLAEFEPEISTLGVDPSGDGSGA